MAKGDQKPGVITTRLQNLQAIQKANKNPDQKEFKKSKNKKGNKRLEKKARYLEKMLKNIEL